MKNKKQGKSYVFSVSVRKGCYRHIKVPEDYTLEELADAILWAFDFDNDHAHAFFMDNKEWSKADSYFYEDACEYEEDRPTCNYKIGEIGLEKGNAFKFLFDFGDNWVFKCKVLRIVDEFNKDAELIKEFGEAPVQYPDYDE